MAGRLRKTRVRLGAVLAILIAAGLVAWLLLIREDKSSFSLKPVAPIAPEALSAADLKVVAAQLGHPVYWAGPKTGYTYEFRRDRGDNVYIRYLPAGTEVDTKGRFLVVGTYRLRDAYGAIRGAAKAKGSVEVSVPNNGLAVYSPSRPTAYWFAYPDTHYQVGVFSPGSKSEARRLVLNGLIVSVA
jgi:hypothetical protein